MKFRKKPVVIEAMQWDGSSERAEEILEWDEADEPRLGWAVDEGRAVDGFIATLEGELHITDGDWIIKGIAGELYPCKPDIFAELYEPVEES